MLLSFEEHRNNLSLLNNWFKSNGIGKMNEAEIRFHLIDELFIKCLGWNKDEIKCEQPLDSKFADYTFYVNQRRCLIVEAKRENIGFEIPAGFSNRTEYKISSLIRDNDEIGAAIRQLIEYCNKRGVEFGVVSNGYQLLALLAHRSDGIEPTEGRAVIFQSLDKMEESFFLLWQILSKEGVLQRRLSLQLIDSELSVLPLKLSAVSDNYPRVARRNELQVDLQIVSEVILEGVNKSEDIIDEFLRETYCTSGALSQYALTSKSILMNRYSLLFEETSDGPIVKEAMTKKGISSEVFGEGLSTRPILLLGDVGSGKSMFINYFIRIEATDVVKKSFTIYVDLGSKAALTADLKEFFLDEVIKIFSDKYDIDIYQDEFVRGVYHGEVLKFQKSIYGRLRESDPHTYLIEEIKHLENLIKNKSQHLKSCFDHITKGWKRQIIIFMDNVDQRDEQIQEDAFFIANEIASSWPAVVFTTLRPSTYTKSKRIGALTGYHPKAFTISPPRIDEVISKRLSFALRIASGELHANEITRGFAIKLQTLTQFIEILQYSFNQNNELIEFVDNICNGNVRKAIEYLTIFIGSGHINAQKILERDIENSNVRNRYLISIHEFVRAIIYREHFDYFPDETDIANLFDVSQEEREHFLMPMFLDYLLRYSNKGQDGFLHTNDLIEVFQDNGFKLNQIEFCILKSIYKGLVETEARKILNIGDALPQACRITTAGAYHLQKLVPTFVYIDAIVVDVPIFNEISRSLIKEENAITERLKRAIIFCDYLDLVWDTAIFKNTGFAWKVYSKKIRQNIEYIQQRIY